MFGRSELRQKNRVDRALLWSTSDKQRTANKVRPRDGTDLSDENRQQTLDASSSEFCAGVVSE